MADSGASRNPSDDTRPTVSLGMPVRNGAATIARAIESVQAQTFEDWELLISDNLSTDETTAICARYAESDHRIRHVPTGRDLAQNENFCEAFRLARGEYFRWYGDDDWLEPEYLELSLQALGSRPDAVLCTTLQQYHASDGPWEVVDRITELGNVDSNDPVERIRQLFRLFNTGDLRGIDPVYSLVRREVMATTSLMAPYRFGDFIFCCEMAVKGRFVHVPRLLAHRQLAEQISNRAAMRRFTGKSGWRNYVQREISLIRVWERTAPHLGRRSRVRLALPLVRFAVEEHAHGVRRRLKALVRA